LTDNLGRCVNECNGGSSEDVVGASAVNGVGLQGVVVGGDEDGNGTINGVGDDTLIKGKGDGDGVATD